MRNIGTEGGRTGCRWDREAGRTGMTVMYLGMDRKDIGLKRR